MQQENTEYFNLEKVAQDFMAGRHFPTTTADNAIVAAVAILSDEQLKGMVRYPENGRNPEISRAFVEQLIEQGTLIPKHTANGKGWVKQMEEMRQTKQTTGIELA